MKFTRLRAKARQVFRRDRGATDPILVIAAIAVSLVLLVGGSFAVAGMIANGKNLNAQGDLDKIATAEAAVASNGGTTYLNWSITAAGAITGDNDSQGNKLHQQAVGFNTTDNEVVKVVAGANGWVAGVQSQSGDKFYRSSMQSTTFKGSIPAANVPTGLTAPTLP
ncbi:hypothetical protein [Curtobacterium sp. MCSS17_016]|uniref:hypothetical protein n=1 Tax=Curtobacterium sp. MCSS17_016 TaxID=2175644 RepID=UPI000DA80DD5|nr:hypothetical protein [Curtobacterium sp. MCSS17_016]WIE80850.1 hypothetical protein DEJ19_020250 [Curtobacterium sp. MCSS17_016]